MYPIEAHFYSDDRFFKMGYPAYESKFAASKICGDKTPDYLFRKRVPQRIYDHNPNAKLIVALRDPVERMYSQYWMYRRTGRFNKSFHAFIRECFFDVVERSRYMPQISRYLTLFDKAQLKIYFTEEFYNNRQATMDDLFDFIGAKPFKIINLKDSHVGAAYKTELLRVVGSYIVKARDRAPWYWLKKPLFYTGHLINMANKKVNIKYPPLAHDIKNRYTHYFKQDINALELFMDRKVPWKGYR